MKLKLLILMLSFTQIGYGQKTLPAKISFLNFTPIIDGKLDEKLRSLEKKKFNFFFQFDNPIADSSNITYRIGYTPTHLYLFIETSADSITYRDRGFTNGDGFKLLLARQQHDSLTDEYYEIVFSPSKNKSYWARKRIWDYNRNQQHDKQLTAATKFEEAWHDGKCRFEVLLAWKDIEPYHPWFGEKLGYNLYFAKAIKGDAANGYSVVQDEGIWDEEIPKRNFMPIIFENPKKVDQEFIITKICRRNIKMYNLLDLELISISGKPTTKAIMFKVYNDSAKVFLSRELTYKLTNKKQQKLVNLNSASLTPSRYNLLIHSDNDTIGQYDFVVFPKLDFDTIRSQILKNQYQLELGTVNTLMFKINSIELGLRKLKVYETGRELLTAYQKFESEYNHFLKGNDPFKGITKPYRRAFKSKYDNTYQPYSIKLPHDYDTAKKYPLLVFLHGSGQDEQDVLSSERSGGNFIEIAPFARDMYYCYSSDSSQKDIVEAIEDVILHFSVDKNKIVVGGFSMGGYGALRTFYEHPEVYKGVAVFAGHPNLANEWLGAGHPNFLDNKFLNSFLNTPVFIYHGRKDGSLSVLKAEELITKLKSKNVLVTERLISDKGHEYPDALTNKIYFDWLTRTLER